MGGDVQDVPFHVVVIISEVNAARDNDFWLRVGVLGAAQVLQIQLVSMIRPRADLQEAFLNIKGEVFHVNRAIAFVDCWRFPYYLSITVYNGLCLQGDLEVAVSAAMRGKGKSIRLVT